LKTLSLTFISMALLFTAVANATDRNSYISNVDKSLTIHRVGILPPTDNVNGLYSRYVEAKLQEKTKKSHRFDVRDLKDIDGHLTLEDYEDDAGLIKKSGSFNKVDAFFSARVNKTKENLTLIMDLFLSSDGKLFTQEQIELPENTGTDELGKKAGELYDKLLEKIPYRGMILSREGNRVTIDLGTQDGIKENTTATVVEIIGLKRHPKFNFVISSEKVILGKIRIIKTDETLSFGLIIQEQERGVIAVDSKLTGVDFVSYPDSMGGMAEVAGDPVSFGKNPKEWTPKKKPGLGKVGLELGAGTLHNAVSTVNEGSLSTEVAIYPQINLTGELWLTPTWFVAARIEEGVTALSNPLSGSSPGSLAATNSHYALHGGYKFFLEDDSFGPEIDTFLGMGDYSFFVDTSTPTAYTSLSYYGVYIGVKGSLPLTRERDWYVNATMNYYFSPGLTETPVTSGTSSNNSITEFTIGGSHRMTDQLWLTGKLDFEFYGTNFSGQGTRISSTNPTVFDTGLNSSQSLFTLLIGMEYVF
jgi:hypothetical protein